MVMESIHGLTAEHIKDTLKTIRGMDREFIIGQMEKFTMVDGRMGNNMEKLLILHRTIWRGEVCGKMGSGSSGSARKLI